MPGLYPETLIQEILDRSNIVELISSYVPLKRAGRNFKAPCPFHPEKTPSFIVSADKQIYHCFGCGEGGNALSFLMRHERVNFREALELLAQKSGIPLPEPEKSSYQKSKENLNLQVYNLYEKTAEFFAENLFSDPESANARAYLKKRGVSKATAQKFRLGFSKGGWTPLIDHLKTKNATLSLIAQSGLAIAKESGGFYDRFRNRIMFPIVDIKDRVVAFGARATDSGTPKYINSPETPIYIKGKHLFGLNIAKDSIRTQDIAIIVEGYLDMIMPFEAGITNIVASLGTALTLDQIRLIKRFTNNIVMLYDSDAAGQLATLRSLELFIQEEVSLKIAKLPAGEDPDSFIRKFGAPAFSEMIEKSKPLFDFKLDFLMSRYDSRTSLGKDRIIKELLPTIKKFSSHTLRSECIRRTSESLNLNEQAVWKDLENLKEDGSLHGESSQALEHYKLKEIPITERMLVKLMLDEMHLIEKLRCIIDPSDFVEEKLRKIVRFIFDFFAEGKSCKPNVLMSYLDDPEAINIISELASLEIHSCPNKEKLISDCVLRLKKDRINHHCLDLQKKIDQAQSSGNQKLLGDLITEFNMLNKQRSQVHGKTCH